MNGQEIEITKERFEEINSAALGPFVEREDQKDAETKKGTKKGKK